MAGGSRRINDRSNQSEIPVQTAMHQKFKKDRCAEKSQVMAVLPNRIFLLSVGDDHTGQFYLTAGTRELPDADNDGNDRSFPGHCPARQQQLFLAATIKYL